jgi:hypothetical protein
VRDDVASEFVDCTVEVKMSSVREEGRVISRVEVSRRVESRRVLGTVEGGINAEKMVVRVDTRATDAVN